MANKNFGDKALRLYKTMKRACCATLFTKKVSAADLDQGGALGNCYYVSSLASIADREPEIIQNLIKDIAEDNFQVVFYDVFDMKTSKFKPQPWKAVTVSIDGTLEYKNGKPKYSYTQEDEHEMWFPLLEKAYASWKGGYDAIGDGGYPDVALSELTGRTSVCISTEAKYFKSAEIQKSTLLGIFEKADRNNWKVVCATKGSLTGVMEEDFKDLKNPDVYSSHAYSYHGYNHVTHLIRLRNPWGEGSNPEGFFWISVPDFLKYYDTISYIP